MLYCRNIFKFLVRPFKSKNSNSLKKKKKKKKKKKLIDYIVKKIKQN